MQPLIPYFQVPVFTIPLPAWAPLPELQIHGFGMLVALGFLLGGWLAMRRAERIGEDPEAINRLIGWLVVGTFVGGHVGYGLMYKPMEYLADPIRFLYFWEGLSSMGGFIVCVPLAIWFFWRNQIPVWPNLDNVAIGFSLGWFFGRMGCTVAHDHPGTPTNFWLGIHCRPVEGRTLALPDWAHQAGYDLRWGPCASMDPVNAAVTDISQTVPVDYAGPIACHDMGFYEALLSLTTLLVFLWLDRRPRFPGFYPLMIGVTYGPARLLMDFLRPESTDGRWFGLTPGQWGSVLIFAVSAYFLYRQWQKNETPVWAPYGSTPATPAGSPDAADAPAGSPDASDAPEPPPKKPIDRDRYRDL